MREHTAAVSTVSLITRCLDPTTERALLVGIPKACIASLQRNSRIEDLKTALPSPILE